MELTKYKIGELIEIVDERNNLGIRDFYGINIKKEFMPTVANTEGLDETKYKVVRKNRFVYSGMQTGRDECIRVSMYNGDVPILVSPAYTMFVKVKSFAPRQIQRRLFAALVTLSRKVFRPWHKWF